MPEAFPLHLIIAIAAILLAARLFGVLFQRIGQSSVVGEMTAGIVLGPSLLGMWFPGTRAYVFPGSIQPVLAGLSQLGLVLFTFVVGLEVDPKPILQQR